MTLLLALAGLGGLLLLGARHFRRVAAERAASPVPVSLLVVARLARAVKRRGGVVAAIGVVGVPGFVVAGDGFPAIVSTIVGCIGLRGLFIARTALRLVSARREAAIAEQLGPVVVVRGDGDEVRLEVGARAIGVARRHAIPASLVIAR
jgi:hypothetical protein